MAKWFSDLGHGGIDPGAVGSGKRESDIVLAAGLEFKKVMEINGEIVKLSREGDNTLSLSQRTNMANSWGADYVISKHVNSAGETAKGTEVFIYRDSGNDVDNKSKRLAQLCLKHTLNAIGEMGIPKVDRGVKVENFHMVRETVAPACLVELDFISNPYIAHKLNGTIYGRHLAYACLEMVGKTVNNNYEKVEYDMNKIVVYFGDADLFGAVMVAQKNQCALMKLSDYKASGLKVKEVIQIGGKVNDTNRYVTFKNAAALV